MLEEKISKDHILAFKEKNVVAKSLLGTIKGEIQNQKKNLMVDILSDEDCNKILTKFAKSLKETISLSGDEKSKIELEIVESYLPKQMSMEEIESKVISLLSNGVTNMGMIMKEFSGLPADKKLVSEIVKKNLN